MRNISTISLEKLEIPQHYSIPENVASMIKDISIFSENANSRTKN